MTEKMRVLVVDDSKVVRKAFSRILGEEYDLVEAENGEDAWDILNQDEEICAVFTDLNMPHLDGQGLVTRIRTSEDKEIKALPVILVTAAGDDTGTTKAALTAGATDYVLKPFDSVFLKSKAQAYVKPRDKALSETKLAMLDPLTRLANKTYFHERGQQEVSAANRHKAEMALVLISIDNYMQLAEQTDNKLLRGIVRKVGTYISSEVRLEDTVARVDKDRFALLLMDTGLRGSIELAGRLKERVRQKTIRHKEKTFKITISVGISALPPEVNRTFDILMMEADRHLREAVSKGGDSIVPSKSGDEQNRKEKIGGGVVSFLDDAMAVLAKRDEKLSPEQAREVIRYLLPILDYCDGILKLGFDDQIKSLKTKYKS
ncbi:MAG TPA: diguanylate cyclase [Gammaproteobacteria bacterium]